MMCMALLVQAYTQASDAEAVCLSGTDSRWRMVLDRLGADEDEPAFSQGGLQQFRERLIATEMDRRLLERTVEVAKRTKGFDPKKTPKTLRVGVDSRPLEGAGRVEDTINLLGHAGRKVAEGMALALGTDVEEVCQQAEAPLLMASSIKAGLDIDWSAPNAKVDALNRLCRQLDRLMVWVAKQSKSCVEAPLTRYIEALAQVRKQDLESRPEGGVQIRQGVAADRRISIEDPDMRHGRKSKRFNGYKQHVGTDLDTELVVACAMTPANRPEEEATSALQEDMAYQELFPDVLLIDRAYLNSSMTADVLASGGDVVCRPWRGASAKPGLFGKSDFKVNIRHGTITCPAGEVEPFEPGAVVQFGRKPASRASCARVVPRPRSARGAASRWATTSGSRSAFAHVCSRARAAQDSASVSASSIAWHIWPTARARRPVTEARAATSLTSGDSRSSKTSRSPRATSARRDLTCSAL
jgi:hypothetical protein